MRIREQGQINSNFLVKTDVQLESSVCILLDFSAPIAELETRKHSPLNLETSSTTQKEETEINIWHFKRLSI